MHEREGLLCGAAFEHGVDVRIFYIACLWRLPIIVNFLNNIDLFFLA